MTSPASAIATPPLSVRVPSFTVVVPVYVFAPPSVNSPVPAFVKLPLPLTTPFQFTALGTVTTAFDVSAPAPPKVSAPLFDKSPNVTSAPIVNPFAITRAVTESLETTTPPVFKVSNPLPNAESFPIRSVPPVTVTPPLNAFAPPKVRIEDPAFASVNALAPIAPPNVTTLGVVSVTFDVNVPAPLSVNAPLFVPSPIVIVPPSEYPFAIEYAVVEALDKVPAVIVKVPVPNAALLPTRTAPDPIVTPPVNVFAPLNTNVPVPPLTKEPPVPLITPLKVVVELPPTVSAFPCKLTLPVPAKLANVSLAPNFRVPGEVTVTAPVSAIATPPFNVSVPPVTDVAPV
jgi:hypothetical protein